MDRKSRINNYSIDFEGQVILDPSNTALPMSTHSIPEPGGLLLTPVISAIKPLAICLLILLNAFSSHAAPKTQELNLSTLRRPEGIQLSSAEIAQERALQQGIREGLLQIERGKSLAATKDGYSKLNHTTIDYSSVREQGQQQIDAGTQIVETGAQELQRLYDRISKRKAQVVQALESGLLRAWTNTQGRTIEAIFISAQAEQVRLQTADGRSHLIPPNLLTPPTTQPHNCSPQGSSSPPRIS